MKLLSRKPVLFIFILILVPTLNALLMKWFEFPVIENMNGDLLMIWLCGFMVFIIELIVILLPTAIPIIGVIYQSYLSRALGFPDEKLDKRIDSLFGRNKKK